MFHGKSTPFVPIGSMEAKMTHPLRLVAVSGGMQRPSKTTALAEQLLTLIANEIACEPR